MNNELLGTKETEEVLDLIDTAVDLYGAAKADGKIDYKDVSLLFAAVPKVGAAFDNIEEVPLELADLSDDELAVLTQKYGNRILNKNYRRVVNGLAFAANAIKDEVIERKAELTEGLRKGNI